MSELTIFIICAIGIMLTEWLLIFEMILLKKELKNLNKNTVEYYEKLFKKMKGLVNIFIASKFKENSDGHIKISIDDFDAEFNFSKPEELKK